MMRTLCIRVVTLVFLEAGIGWGVITTKDLLPLWATIVCSFALGLAAKLVGEWLADCAKRGAA